MSERKVISSLIYADEQNQKKQGFFVSHKMAFCFFCFLLFYGFVVVCRCELTKVEEISYIYHAVDFSVGFCSKILPGAIYNLFVKYPSPLSATIYEYILLGVFLLCVSFLLERYLLSFPVERRVPVFALAAFFLTGPGTLGTIWLTIGFLDVSWIYMIPLFVLALQNRKTRYLLPLFFAAAVMIHFAAMITYILLFALLILFELIISTEKKDRRQLFIIFLVCAVVSSGLSVYFALNEKKNVKMDLAEFHQYLVDREVENPWYYEYAFYYDPNNVDEYFEVTDLEDQYGDLVVKELFPDHQDNPLVHFLNAVYSQIQVHVFNYSQSAGEKLSVLQSIFMFVILSPFFYLFYWLLFFLFRKAKGNKLDRFVFFCMMMLAPTVVFGSTLLATGRVRFLYHAFFMLFILVLYIIYKEKETATVFFSKQFSDLPKPALCGYFIVYFCSVISPLISGG